MSGRLNLSAWALQHRSMVLYLIIVLTVAGAFSFFHLGRAEDPDFTFKIMVVRTLWPGATAHEVEQELTERIEKKLQETPYIDMLRSASRAGESLVFLTLKDYTPKAEVPESWRQVRKKLDDIRGQLPAGVQGPYPNDEFGDVYVNIYALTGDGYDMGQLRQEATRMARALRAVPDVKKVDLLGVQDEKIYVEVAPARLAALGVTPAQVAEALARQNAVAPAGFVETASDRVRLRVSGPFDSVEQIRGADLAVGGRHFRLGDIATVQRGFADPPNPRMRFGGKDAVGVAVAMARGGNVMDLGSNLQAEIDRLARTLPVGMEVATMADQPNIVRVSLKLFLQSLAEALAIVLAVSFLSLGFRTGLVVALSIPLVLAVTFLLMKIFGIDLHRISLGALIIALGLLVDDAIIAAEMMVVKIEQGWEKFSAATFAYTSTAFPMLTGTLITAAGFTPVGFAKSGAGEYAGAIFSVTVIALLTSWLVAVVFTPYLGYRLLDEQALRKFGAEHHGDIYDTPFYNRFRALVVWCLRHRWTTIAVTLLAFALGLVAFGTGVQKQFFPPSNRPELLVDLWLPQGASLKATESEVRRVETLLRQEDMATRIASHASFIGNGAPRFYLPLDQQLFNDNFGQLVIVTRGFDEREEVRRRLMAAFAAPDGSWSHLRTRVQRLENGPPVGFPVVFRVRGRGCRYRARHRPRGGSGDARQSQRARCASGLEREGQERARRDRPGPCAAARRIQPGRRAGAAGARSGRDPDAVSRRRPADRRGLARAGRSGRPRQARPARRPARPGRREMGAARPGGEARAGARGRNHLAPRPAADDPGARRPGEQYRHRPDRDAADRSAARGDPRPPAAGLQRRHRRHDRGVGEERAGA